MTPQNTRFFATTSVGLEQVLSAELESLGASSVEPSRGGVYFEAQPGKDSEKEIMYKANLWLRTATRVLKPIKEFSAKDAKMLYSQIFRLHWEEFLNPTMTFAVSCTFGNVKRQDYEGRDGGKFKNEEYFTADKKKKGLIHSHYVALKIKDAIVDRLRTKYGERPDVSKTDPDLKIHAYLHNGKCMLSFDSSGSSLHERGYRVHITEAPLKETLAAGMILMTGWKGDTAFYDPMCGSGTIAIEAAMIAKNIAPGLLRKDFGFMRWRDFDKKLWKKLVDEANEAVKDNIKPVIYASDKSKRALETAKTNATRAGFGSWIKFEVKDFFDSTAPVQSGGVMVFNPPYGDRLGKLEDMSSEYKRIGDTFKQKYPGWNAFVFTGNLDAAKSLGLKASRRFELFNGQIECRLLKYELFAGKREKLPGFTGARHNQAT